MCLLAYPTAVQSVTLLKEKSVQKTFVFPVLVGKDEANVEHKEKKETLKTRKVAEQERLKIEKKKIQEEKKKEKEVKKIEKKNKNSRGSVW